MKFVKGNNKFWKKNLASFLKQNEIKVEITLIENDEIISCDIEVAKPFQNFFSSIVKNLDIQRDKTHLSKTTQDNPVLTATTKIYLVFVLIAIFVLMTMYLLCVRKPRRN